MAQNNPNSTPSENPNSKVGFRTEVSQEAYDWIEETAKATGLERGELIELALESLRNTGKKTLADAILANAQAKVKALLGMKD